MDNKRILYFNIVSLSLLLLHMGLNLFILNGHLSLAQGSEGLVSAEVNFFGYEILTQYHNQYRSFISPSITLTLFFIINLLLLVKFWKLASIDRKIILFNSAMIALSIFLYKLFLYDLNHNLELTAVKGNLYFRELNLFGFEGFGTKIGEGLSVLAYDQVDLFPQILFRAVHLCTSTERCDLLNKKAFDTLHSDFSFRFHGCPFHSR